MGQKIHPTGFRLPVTRNWSSRWYASNKNFATMLAEGLGEHAAADTLAAAVTDVCGTGKRPLDRLLHGVAATTRQFTDSVLAGLPATHSSAEFFRESRA